MEPTSGSYENLGPKAWITQAATWTLRLCNLVQVLVIWGGVTDEITSNTKGRLHCEVVG